MRDKVIITSWIQKALAALTGAAIYIFLNNATELMPVNFPYSKGWWGATGVGVIMVCMFLLIFIVGVIQKRLKVDN